VAKSTRNYLKLYNEQTAQPAPSEPQQLRNLPTLLEAFRQATGWSLAYRTGPSPRPAAGHAWVAPINHGTPAAPGYLILDPGTSGSKASITAERAQQLTSALAAMLAESLQIEHALWQREAELAAGVPLVPTGNEEKHLAERLEAVLKGGAEAVGAHAAAIYLLDEATTRLKLRACWGLPRQQLRQPARPLRGALADLEALLGHAVVLDHEALVEQWRAPEPFPAAACVPISTATTILGTFWVFSRVQRPFDDHQTNMLEVVAGRLAAELEREMLLREGIEGARVKRQLAAAERAQQDQLPSTPPQSDIWDLWAWTGRAQAVGGDFFDWYCLPDGTVTLVVGQTPGRGIEAALTAAAAKAAVRAHGQHEPQVDRLLQLVNRTLWTNSAGGQLAAAFCVRCPTQGDRLSCAAAGPVQGILVRPDGWNPLTSPAPSLGQQPDLSVEPRPWQLLPGQAMVLVTAGVSDARDSHGRVFGEAGVAELVSQHLDQTARQLTDLVRDRLDVHTSGRTEQDRTVLVLKRRAP